MQMEQIILAVVSIGIIGIIHAADQKDSVDISSIMNHISQLEAQLHSTMSALQTTMDDLQATKIELEVTRSELTSRGEEINETRRELKLTQSELQANRAALNQTGQRLEITKSELQRMQEVIALKTREVAFRVYLTSKTETVLNIVENTAIKFNSIQYNAGNGYDISTGKFIAPVSGIYIFSAQSEMYNGNTAQGFTLWIAQSGILISGGYAETSGNTDDISATTTTITSVREGEAVYVYISHSAQVYVKYRVETSFTGALLAAH